MNRARINIFNFNPESNDIIIKDFNKIINNTVKYSIHNHELYLTIHDHEFKEEHDVWEFVRQIIEVTDNQLEQGTSWEFNKKRTLMTVNINLEPEYGTH